MILDTQYMSALRQYKLVMNMNRTKFVATLWTPIFKSQTRTYR
jgi:hypothetical protein